MNDNKKIYFSIMLVAASAALIYAGGSVIAENTIASKVKGKIVLQVEDNGEAWYINPDNLKKYYLGRPDDAFDLMKKLSLGITNQDLAKIPVGLIEDNNTDTDGDGLNDDLEKALGTDPDKKDTDSDSYDDKTELEKDYDPNGNGKLKYDSSFIKTNAGKIFLQVESNGSAWYVNPTDNKRYFLNRPADAFSIMKGLGLGIKSSDLATISTYYDQTDNQTVQDQEASSTSTDKEYSNSSYGYSLKYPAKWQVKTFSSAPAMTQITDAKLDYISENKGVIVINYLGLDAPIENVDHFRVASKSPSKTLTDEAKKINDLDAYENSYEHQLAYEKTTTIKTSSSSEEFVMVTLATTNGNKDAYEKIYDAVVASIKFGE